MTSTERWTGCGLLCRAGLVTARSESTVHLAGRRDHEGTRLLNVWLVQIGEEIPTDPGPPRLLRTGILARHLVARGHRVTWWNASVNHQQKLQRSEATTAFDTPFGYRQVLLHGRLYSRHVSIARMLSHRENAAAFRAWSAREPRPDVVVCGYPTIELAAAVAAYATANRVPLIVDFRDMWPDLIESQLSQAARIMGWPLFRHWYGEQRRIVQQATSIIGITEPFVDWALRRGGRARGPLDRAFHLATDTQTPDADTLSAADARWRERGLGARGEHFVMAFAGTLSARLDIGTVVKAAVQLDASERTSVRLVCCGRGDQDAELRALAAGCDHILFPGWVGSAEIHALLSLSDVGVLPYPSSPDFHMSYPNKVGEYLGAGLPVMTCLDGLTRDLLAERGIGHFFTSGDVGSAVACLRTLLANRDALAAQRPRARQTFDDLFNPGIIYTRFCDHVETVARQGLPTTTSVGRT